MLPPHWYVIGLNSGRDLALIRAVLYNFFFYKGLCIFFLNLTAVELTMLWTFPKKLIELLLALSYGVYRKSHYIAKDSSS
jgi:hypothetical protein